MRLSCLLGCLLIAPGVLTNRISAHAASGGSIPLASGLALRPTARYQSQTFRVPGPRSECQALARAHPGLGSTPCFMSVSVELVGKGVQPMMTGGPHLSGPHVQTGYASITVCLSGSTLSGRGNCYGTVQTCINHLSGNSPPPCYPSWNARVSTEFQYNGRDVRRIWLDPSLLTGLGFIVRTTRSFSLPRCSCGAGHLDIGEDVTVTGTIPTTRGVKAAHVLRMTVYPNGAIRYSAR